jgi:hypothetical protein
MKSNIFSLLVSLQNVQYICVPHAYMSAEYLINAEQIFDKRRDIEYGMYSSVIQIIDV